MNWREYFEQNNGPGYLVTADKEGRVNIAPYFRPEVLEDGTLAFAMSDGRSYENVRENPHASYTFNEGSYKGVRVYLERHDETPRRWTRWPRSSRTTTPTGRSGPTRSARRTTPCSAGGTSRSTATRTPSTW